MTQPQEVLAKYQKLLSDNNSIERSLFSSIVLNGTEIQNSNNIVSKQIRYTKSREKVIEQNSSLGLRGVVFVDGIASLVGVSSTPTEIPQPSDSLGSGTFLCVGQSLFGVWGVESEVDKKKFRFTRYEDITEITSREIEGGYYGLTTETPNDFVQTSTGADLTITALGWSFAAFSENVFFTFENYSSGALEQNTNNIIGYAGSTDTFTLSSIDLEEDRTRTNSSQIIIPTNGDVSIPVAITSYFANDIEIPLNSHLVVDLLNFDGYGRVGEFARHIASNSQFTLIWVETAGTGSSPDYGYRFYTNTSFVVRTEDPFANLPSYSLPDDGYIFSHSIYTGIFPVTQINTDGSLTVLRGMTSDYIVTYNTKRFEDDVWSANEEIFVGDLGLDPSNNPIVGAYLLGISG
jgi:hypothetical protein